jgi:hypothetical protein
MSLTNADMHAEHCAASRAGSQKSGYCLRRRSARWRRHTCAPPSFPRGRLLAIPVVRDTMNTWSLCSQPRSPSAILTRASESRQKQYTEPAKKSPPDRPECPVSADFRTDVHFRAAQPLSDIDTYVALCALSEPSRSAFLASAITGKQPKKSLIIAHRRALTGARMGAIMAT